MAGITAQVLKDPEALALMQSKLAGMVGTMSGYYATLPKVVKRRVKALKKLQVDALKIEARMAEEIHELECKYAALFEPLHLKRADIVNAVHEPTDEEADFPSDDEEEEDEGEENGGDGDGEVDGGEKTALLPDKKKEADQEAAGETNNAGDDEAAVPGHGFDETTKGIPEFWLTIFKNVELIGDNIQEHDEPILSHLTDLRVKNTLKPKGFTLEFHFSPNEHFTNSVLTKQYELKCEVDPDDPFSFEGAEISRCKGCEINWKKGKNVTIRQVTKKQKHKTKGTTRSVTKQVQNDSFFNFFSPPPSKLPLNVLFCLTIELTLVLFMVQSLRTRTRWTTRHRLSCLLTSKSGR